MKIGDEVYVHGYVDEIRKGVVIIRNEGGYFGTVPSEIIADRKTEPNCSEKPNNCKDEPMKTADYCDICKRDMCEDCIADATNPYCVPSHFEINYKPKDEPTTQTETQNSNLTFEKADERCKGCKHYKLTCDLFSEICKYEPKYEPQTEDLQDWKDRMWAEAIVIEPITEDCSMISCLKCEHNEHCHYLVKDIPWSDCPWKRRYEYNRLCSIING